MGSYSKNLLFDHALPNFEDSIITFNSYPPGSALFIYYFSVIVGQTEGIALIAQAVAILSGILPLFSISSFNIFELNNKKLITRKILLTLISILVSIYLLNGPTTVKDLLVDTLLNVVGIELFTLIFYFDKPRKIWLPVISLASYLTIMKNSGMFCHVPLLYAVVSTK